MHVKAGANRDEGRVTGNPELLDQIVSVEGDRTVSEPTGNPLFEGLKAAHRRTIYKGAGLDDVDIRKPHVGIVNAYTDASPAYMHLRSLAEAVRAGILEEGGMPFEFGTFATCGNISVGTEDLKYELVIRDVLAGSIEIMSRVHHFNGLVLLSSTDSIIPGHIIGALRLGLPTVYVSGGPMLSGKWGGRRITTADVNEAVFGALDAGLVTDEEVTGLEENACPTAGACPVMGTANTMQILAEVMGLALPGSSTIPAVLSDKTRAARLSGRAIVRLIKKGVSIRDIVDHRAITNAVKADLAIGGSTNAVLHLLTFARELGLQLSLDDFDRLSRTVPVISAVVPNGSHTVDEFHFAGGVPVLLKTLGDLIDTSARTVTGLPWAAHLKEVKPGRGDVIVPRETPVFAEGGLAVLRGNLAPNGAIIRQSAMRREMLRFRGRARVFSGDQEGYEALKAGRIRAGDILVVRYEGVVGAPGMKEIMLCSDAIFSMNLGASVGLITDGRFSGFNRGPVVGHISPEAAVGGPLALVREGDEIEIDVPNRRLHLFVTDEELAARQGAWQPPEPKTKDGVLALYARMAAPPEDGAAMQPWAVRPIARLPLAPAPA
jgi:dihydroxy-acid dehydratase